MLRVAGHLGSSDGARAAAMAELLADVEPAADIAPVLKHANAHVWGTQACRTLPSGPATWSPTPLADSLPDDPATLAADHDTAVISPDDASLHTGISGAVPLYADGTADTLHFCSRIEPLARTRPIAPTPDWDAWAHIIAMGAPLEGRTGFAEIRRIPAWTTLAPGDVIPQQPPGDWPWLSVERSDTASVDDVRAALADTISALAARTPLASLLTGGWDSRVLATFAARTSDITSWTTSSDNGHVLEELIGRRVADKLGIAHRIVPPRWDEFDTDFDTYSRMVDSQASFHSWLVRLARTVAATGATVLDGLGGGLFVGGDFPDTTTGQPPVDVRFNRLAHYLGEANSVLHPRVAAQVRERTKASFTAMATPVADHPFGASFTAYLTRTVPGISLSPYGVVGHGSPAATPFLNNDVVRAALAIPPQQHAGGRLYPELIRPIAPDAADLATAVALAPNYRRHRRRISSIEGASRIRELALRDPVRSLLSTRLAGADIGHWQQLLDRTRAQHLLRGLAMLSLWLEQYADLLGEVSPEPLREALG